MKTDEFSKFVQWFVYYGMWLHCSLIKKLLWLVLFNKLTAVNMTILNVTFQSHFVLIYKFV